MPDLFILAEFQSAVSSRICVGLNLANQMLFIDIATILWALNIDRANGSDGNPIIPSRHDFIDTGIVVLVFFLSLNSITDFHAARQFSCTFQMQDLSALSGCHVSASKGNARGATIGYINGSIYTERLGAIVDGS